MLLFVASVGIMRHKGTFTIGFRSEGQFQTVHQITQRPDFAYLHSGPEAFNHKEINGYIGPMYMSWQDTNDDRHIVRIEIDGRISKDQIDPYRFVGKPDPEDVLAFESFVSRGADQQPVVPVSVKRE